MLLRSTEYHYLFRTAGSTNEHGERGEKSQATKVEGGREGGEALVILGSVFRWHRLSIHRAG